MPLLNGRFELHQPGCDGRGCVPNECVRDVEAFCGAVLDKFNRGERVGHQAGSHAFQSPADKEDALAFLIGVAWQAWLDFRPDDGRGSNRFGGYLSWLLYRRHTDWLRKRYGSTRYGPVPVFTPTADPGQHTTEGWLDPEYDDSDALDLEAAPAGTREALELLQPLIDGEVQTVNEAAALAQVEPRQVERAWVLVRAAARRQGLEPASEERHELANQARDLREQHMTYRQIADELGLHSSSTAITLIRDFHPELIKPTRKHRDPAGLPAIGTATRTRVGASPMKSRDGQRNPCVYCKSPTIFLRAIVGSNSTHPEWEDCCADCGERPARREQLAMTAA